MVASIKPHRDELGLGDGLMLIDGRWAAAADSRSWSHTHPATGEQVASFPVAGPADVDLAVRAARRAFDEGPWPRARANERVRVLRKIADLVRGHADELQSGIGREGGRAAVESYTELKTVLLPFTDEMM
jgi:aldehyde dehydrogenase (NAD+)